MASGCVCGVREKTQGSETFTTCQEPCPVCELCGNLQDLRLCAGCKDAWYCSKDHQVSHWPQHKTKCKKSRRCKCDSTGGKSGAEDISTKTSDSARVAEENNSNVELKGEKSLTEKQLGESTSRQTHMHENTVTSNNASDNKENQIEVEGKSPDISLPREGAVGGCVPTTAQQEKATSKSTKEKSAKMTLKKNEVVVNKKSGVTKSGGVISSKKGRSGKGKPRRNSGTSSPAASLTPTSTTQAATSETDKSNEGLSDYVVKCLTEYGICVVDQFLGDTRGTSIYEEVVRVRDDGCLRDGQLVSNLGYQRKIRGDEITWVEKGDAGRENTSFLMERLDSLLIACNTKLQKYEIGGRTKAMVACYPGNATYYLRHVDNPNGDGRLITCIYYLNKDWDVKRDGGILRIFPESVKNSWVADIEPKFDRLLFFWSDRRNPHEVQAAYKTRFAITVWYFDKAERQRALMRFEKSEGDDGQTDARTMSASLGASP